MLGALRADVVPELRELQVVWMEVAQEAAAADVEEVVAVGVVAEEVVD